MTTPLQDRLAVITGAASGIGEACARLLDASGARLVVADIDAPRARAVAETLGQAIATPVDVTDPDAVEALADRLGPIDILITSAGILQPPLPPDQLPQDIWDQVVAVDQRGVYLCCRAFGTRMAIRGAGAIVNIASVAGMRAMPLHAYAPAKAAVIAITEALAAEWGRSGVRVNAVAPGFTRTPALQAAADAGQRDLARIAAASAMGRLVDPDEIARAVAFLASDDASAITGVTLPVDAGWLVAGSWAAYGGVPPSRTNTPMDFAP